MSESDVSPDAMPTPPLDANTADRLLGGAIHPDDAPNGYQRVAALITVAGGPATAAEQQKSPPDLAVLVTGTDEAGRSRRRSRRRFTKVAVAATVLCLGASSAAAATGNLPDPVQRAVSSVASQFGVSIPEPTSPLDTTNEGPEPVSEDPVLPTLTTDRPPEATIPQLVDVTPINPGTTDPGDVVPSPSVPVIPPVNPDPVPPSIPNSSCTAEEILERAPGCISDGGPAVDDLGDVVPPARP